MFVTADLPPASLIICSRNRADLLAQTVTSILDGDEVPTEIIIVDQSDQQHPTLASLTAIRNCNIRYHWSHSVGVSRARNDGIAIAQHEILVITDDDMIATNAWFSTIVKALHTQGTKSVISGQVLPFMPEDHTGFAPSTKMHQAASVYEGRIFTDVLYTGNMALHRSTFDDIGKFDERLGPGTGFPAAEDNDLGYRLLEAGYHIIYLPEALLYHSAWRPERDYALLHWNYGCGQGAFFAKHSNMRDRFMLWRMVGEIKHSIGRAIKCIHDARHEAYANILYALGIVYGSTKWLLSQREKQK